MKYKCIVVCGDSFFAGDELAIDEFYQDYQTLYSERVEDRLPSDKKLKSYSILNKDLKYESYRNKCIELRFTTTIEKYFNIPIFNLSRGGFSNSAIVSRILDFLCSDSLKKYKPEEIYVVLGLTGLERFMIPNKLENRNYDAIPFNFRPDGDRGKIFDWFMKNYSANYVITDNLLHILGVINFLKSNNISYSLVDSYLYTYNLCDAEKICKEELEIFLKLFPKPDIIMETLKIDNEKVYHEMGHFSKVIHERLAQQFISKFLND